MVHAFTQPSTARSIFVDNLRGVDLEGGNALASSGGFVMPNFFFQAILVTAGTVPGTISAFEHVSAQSMNALSTSANLQFLPYATSPHRGREPGISSVTSVRTPQLGYRYIAVAGWRTGRTGRTEPVQDVPRPAKAQSTQRFKETGRNTSGFQLWHHVCWDIRGWSYQEMFWELMNSVVLSHHFLSRIALEW